MAGSGSGQGASEYEVAEIPQVNIGSAPAGGGYTVDPERAPRLIQALKDARSMLGELRDRHEDLRYIPKPDGDPFSIAAADAVRRMLGNEPGGYEYANRSARDQLTALIDKLEASLKVYRDNEERSRRNFTRGV
ncbi:hypothetical protein [Allokutzneria oryzae]|uniref:PE domain-containing protein n=1 Tax=Allokutzneria oryzae TaxID=1378989 RepID=A0ABV5ZRC0_9PSEU